MSLSNPDLHDDKLRTAFLQVPDNSILALEDIDAIFTVHREKKGDSQLTFAGLLNALDGVVHASGLLIAMTTNHVDRIDAALLRPGRVDYRLGVDHVADAEVRRFVQSFYPVSSEVEQNSFVSALREAAAGKPISLAEIQEHLLRFTGRPLEDASRGVREAKNSPIALSGVCDHGMWS